MPNAFQMPHKCEMFSLQLCRDEKGPVSESTDGDLLCPDIVVAPCAWPGLGLQAAKVNEAQSRRFKPSGVTGSNTGHWALTWWGQWQRTSQGHGDAGRGGPPQPEGPEGFRRDETWVP